MQLLKKFPKELIGSWFTIEDMISLFRNGGLSCVSTEDASKAFKHNRNNRTMDTFYCSFGYQCKENIPVAMHC